MPKRLLIPDETVKKLIAEVKKRNSLWNIPHEEYNDRYLTTQAWTEIAVKLQVPEAHLRIKWKNIRDMFRKEARKCPNINDYKGKWRLFKALKFLHAPYAERNGDSTDEESVVTKREKDDDYYVDVDQNNDIEGYFDEIFDDPIPEKKRKTSVDSATEDDYDVMFLKSLAPYFKNLDPVRKLVVRNKMQDMLLSEIAQSSNYSKS